MTGQGSGGASRSVRVRGLAQRWRRCALLVAVPVLLPGCAPSVPPLADAALPAAGAAVAEVRVVYVAPAAEGCAGSSLSGAAAYGDRLVLSEDTCTAEAGGDDSERQFRLVEVSPAEVRAVPLPEGVSSEDGLRVLGASDDGAVFLSTTDYPVTSLWRRSPDGEWSLLTRPAEHGERSAGDGGPAVEAVVAFPEAVVVGPDGSVFVRESNAVRRIDPDGIIETVAGSDRLDSPEAVDTVTWGGAGFPYGTPDPRPLPPGPVVATDVPLPRLTAMDVADDGTVWLASHDAVLRLGTDGLIVVHADASTMVPDSTASALVGRHGASSIITGLAVVGDSLLLVDSWSDRLLRLRGQELSLVAGRPEEERASCPRPVLDATLTPDQVCAGTVLTFRGSGSYVTHDEGIVTIPGALLDRP